MHDRLLLELGVVLLVAKLGGEICERFLKQPAVLGELICGVLVGNSALGWVDSSDPILIAMAGLGSVFLLFEVGLTTHIDELLKVGISSTIAAVAGVLFSFAFCWLAMKIAGVSVQVALFLGASMAASSVGIAARVFGDMKQLGSPNARIVLSAAVIDDVIGLLILAVVSGIVATGDFTGGILARLIVAALTFLVGGIVLGLRAAPWLLKVAHKMQTRAALSSAVVVFCLMMAWFAAKVQLAPIVGAFAAGLILAKAEHKVHFEQQIKSIAELFIPVFFVLMGARVDVSTLNPVTVAGRATLIIGGLLLVAAIGGKLLCGVFTPKRIANRWTIGAGLIPRGEVALIFGGIGISSKLIQPMHFSAIVFVVVGTALICPPLLGFFLKQRSLEPKADPKIV